MSAEMSEGVNGSMSETRRALLEATLVHVPFDGWSDRALRAGAKDAGIGLDEARRAFPTGITGVRGVLALWSADSDRRMSEELEAMDLGQMRVRDRIAAAVRVRLGLLTGHREALRLALARAVLPGNAPAAMRALYCTVDAMWRAAGDTATDFNFYTKRGLLAAVWSSTLLYWLDDKSEDHEATWAFLDRRIADVMKVPRAIQRLRAAVPGPRRSRSGRKASRAA